jgi:hypothetical protein
MRPAVRFAFVLGALVALAAAVAGIVIYANHPGSNFDLIGWDELQHRENADILVHGGRGSLVANLLYAEALTGDAAWGNGAVIALCTYLFGTDLSFMAFKWVLHVAAALLLYQLVRKYRGENVACFAALFFLIYPPLLVYEASFLKDDLLAALVIITAVTIDRRWYIAALPLVLLVITVRANAVLFPVILLGYLRRSRLRYFALLAAVPLAAALVMVSQGYFQLLARIWQLPVTTILFYIAKYLLGPLPTNILDWETEVAWIFPWYVLSFLAIIAGFFVPAFYSSIRANWRWIVLLVCVCLAPYLPYVTEADVIGPRQFSVVGWLYFLLFYERLLDHRLRIELRPGVERTWSAAT